MKKLLSLFLLGVTIFSCVDLSFAEEKNTYGFDYNGKPINAFCIANLNSETFGQFDVPYIGAINLDVCQKYTKKTVNDQKLELDPNNPTSFSIDTEDGPDGTYSYQVMGKAQNGIYVLRTLENPGDGGPGQFDKLLLVQLKNKKLIGNSPSIEKPFPQLVVVGRIQGGDRAQGSFNKIEIKDNSLIFNQFQGANATDFKMENGEPKVGKEITIDLSKVE